MTLTDNLPAGYTWTLGGADAADCSINTAPNPDVLSCNFGTLADDETRTITLSAPTTGGELRRHPEHGERRRDQRACRRHRQQLGPG